MFFVLCGFCFLFFLFFFVCVFFTALKLISSLNINEVDDVLLYALT